MTRSSNQRVSRRLFTRLGLGSAAAALVACGGTQVPGSRVAPGAARRGARGDAQDTDADLDGDLEIDSLDEPVKAYDYIVIGSGAGGGPVACNLARAGFRILLLEAGSGELNGARQHYEVPALHAFASENPEIAWRYFVRHSRRDGDDSKNVLNQGKFYPRGSTLGGSTAVNAMITMVPHERDWQGIAELVKDPSWQPERMARYFKQIERCRHAQKFEAGAAGHGFEGWLPTEQADPALLFQDPSLLRLVSAATSSNGLLTSTAALLRHGLDPNATVRGRAAIHAEGIFNPPLATERARRRGAREYILATKAHPEYGKNLTIETDALATRLVLDDEKRAIAVEYRVGKSLYRADARHAGAKGSPRAARAKKEIIVAAGAFNTPQLLKLSGIGPREELRKHGIDVKVPLPGVGANLQDRYEVSVVNELNFDVQLTKDCTFGGSSDPCLDRHARGTGPYQSNGTAIGVARKSRPDLSEPDLFIFGLPSEFKGYYPGYSKAIAASRKHFSWVILKGHTNNSAGTVSLRSRDPTETPEIDFRSFADGNDASGDDLRAVVEGVKIARSLNRSADFLGILPVNDRETVPGREVRDDAQVRDFVQREAWGHHASCSCKMGPKSDPLAVVDANFRVHGVTGLRIVDASVFPKIPGLFIAVSVYMIAQKASEVILLDAGVTNFDSLDFKA